MADVRTGPIVTRNLKAYRRNKLPKNSVQSDNRYDINNNNNTFLLFIMSNNKMHVALVELYDNLHTSAEP
jgi:hypothetical protein